MKNDSNGATGEAVSVEVPEVELDLVLHRLIAIAECAHDLAMENFMGSGPARPHPDATFTLPVTIADQILAVLRFGCDAARMHPEGRQ
ncbi:hypothetical protein [Aureimonas leprariae]|uniref:hypothetical protein n=1 Tax=Plantimonas leprariae TaxID=2615207 RepID=UPI001AEE2414|nr:hypothetical protein [Aureimonas leprariae]